MSRAKRTKKRSPQVNVNKLLDDLLHIYATKGEEAFNRAKTPYANLKVDDDVALRFAEACTMIRDGLGMFPDPQASTERTRSEAVGRFRLRGEFMSFRLSVLGVYVKKGKAVIAECLALMLGQVVDTETEGAEALLARMYEGSLEVFFEPEESPIRKRYFDMLDFLKGFYSQV
jgi:hypothetical protein